MIMMNWDAGLPIHNYWKKHPDITRTYLGYTQKIWIKRKLHYSRALLWSALKYFNAPVHVWKDETAISLFIIIVCIGSVTENWRR